MTVTCPTCGNPAKLVDGRAIYPHRPDLYEKKFWSCRPCAAFCGCHPGTEHPLGTLADKKTRLARSALHAAFDDLWKSKAMSRDAAYEWLGKILEVGPQECHIGMFDAKTCWRAVAAVKDLDLTKLPGVKAFKCPDCSKRFADEKAFNQHKWAKHRRAA